MDPGHLNIRLSGHAMHYSYDRDSAIGLPKAKPPVSASVCVQLCVCGPIPRFIEGMVTLLKA